MVKVHSPLTVQLCARQLNILTNRVHLSIHNLTLWKQQLACAYPLLDNKSRKPTHAICCYHKIVWICGHEHVKIREKIWKNWKISLKITVKQKVKKSEKLYATSDCYHRGKKNQWQLFSMLNVNFTIQLAFLPCFPYLFTFQLTFLPYFPYHFTIQPTFLPHFPHLFTIQLGFLPYFSDLFTVQLAFLPYCRYRHRDVTALSEEL